MIAALDLATGQMTYRIRDRKRWGKFLAFLKLLCARWPGGKLYLVLDNFSPHKHPKVTSGAAEHNMDWTSCPPTPPGRTGSSLNSPHCGTSH